MDIIKLSIKIERLITKYGNQYALKKVDGSTAGKVTAILDEQVKRDEQGVIKVTKVMFIAGTSKAKPDVGMFVTDEKQVYRIKSVETIRPTGKALLFQAVVEV